MSSLLSLSDTPEHHPDCCLSLSVPLISKLHTLFVLAPASGSVQRSLVLSIGSGTGLLEAILLQCHQKTTQHVATHTTGGQNDDLSIIGVEVRADPPVNKYLPEEFTYTVNGTWDDICTTDLAVEATALMFVYPRNTLLVSKYVDLLAPDRDTRGASTPGTAGRLRCIVWLGPRADWKDFEPCFTRIDGAWGDVEVAGGEEDADVDGNGAGLASYEMMAILTRRPENDAVLCEN